MTTEPHALDLFPEECPAPTAEQLLAAKQAKKGATAKAPRPFAPATGKALVASLGGAREAVSAMSASSDTATPTPLGPQTAAGKANPDGLESLARQLEAHADYRILRRLQPRLEWPSSPSADQHNRVQIVVLDTETTGLDFGKECIIELAMLRVEVDTATGMPVGKLEVYDELEDPGRPIPKEVVAITGITDDDVRGKKLDDVRVIAMLAGADLVIAHNAGFDRPFVERRFPQFAALPWACSFADIDWKALGQGSAKLESLAQTLGWFYDAHRAEMDCHALLAVLATPFARVAGQVMGEATDIAQSQTAVNGLAQLFRAAQSPSYLLQATSAPFESKDLLKARGYRWNTEGRVWVTRISSEEALQAECQWLRSQVYGHRPASVRLEKQDALNRYSGRTGQIVHHSV